MKTAVALMALIDGNDTVYVSRHGVRFHEDPGCRALGAGHMIFACRCGDPYCGCATDKPPVPMEVSIGDAASRDLIPCAVCYPGFGELAVQIPADDGFGHLPVDEYEYLEVRASRIVCRRCTVWTRIHLEDSSEVYLMGHRVKWPCMSSVVLGLAPRREGFVS